jgi:hypothetical protein
MRLHWVATLLCVANSITALAQLVAPGTTTIDGISVACGSTWTLLDRSLADAGHWDGYNYIRINPDIFDRLPSTEIKLFVYSHECGHVMGNIAETAADCFAVTLGKAQGWFTLDDFDDMAKVFANNPGDFTHPPGPERVALMKQCFNNAP